MQPSLCENPAEDEARDDAVGCNQVLRKSNPPHQKVRHGYKRLNYLPGHKS